MTTSLVTVKRIYNNNVVLCVADDDSEVVLIGKGLGYAAKVGDPIDSAAPSVQRFVPDQNYGASHVAELLGDASLEETEVTREIVSMASDVLGLKASQRLLLPLLDHLSFAVSRAREGIEVDFPLRWEVAQVFPKEADAGRRALQLVHDRLGVRLQADEWSAFALHFVTYQWSGGDLEKTLSMADTITKAFALLETEWGQPVDQTSMSSARFVTHLRYLWIRTFDNKQLEDSPIELMASVMASYPAATTAAEKLAHLFESATGTPLTSEEIAYLALHTSRLYIELHRTD
ncbi:PRD domain-containing protein [Streptomyces sp. OE57]|uniref:PRD domain-containing protein n=1 Tax=Streptomyces lacaronensis TaxID=3379885 RepID=UPI0039B73D6C